MRMTPRTRWTPRVHPASPMCHLRRPEARRLAALGLALALSIPLSGCIEGLAQDHDHSAQSHQHEPSEHGSDAEHAHEHDEAVERAHGHAHDDEPETEHEPGYDREAPDPGDRHAEDHEDHGAFEGAVEGAIEFPVAQQERMAFAVREAVTDTISERLSLPARVEPRPGQAARVTAPVDGMLALSGDGRWKRPGDRVEPGEVLGRLVPLSGAEDVSLLQLDRTEARERLSLARAERDRVQTLFERGVVSEKRLDETEAEYRVAQQALERARSRIERVTGGREGSDDAIVLRAPIGGVVTASPFTPGERVAADDVVISLLDERHVWLRAMAYPADLGRIREPDDLVARQAGAGWRSFPEARLVYRGTRAEENGTIPLVFEIPNPSGELVPGTAWTAAFATGQRQESVVLPESAVLDDDGVPVVIVRHHEAHFERRPVETGIRSGGRVAITAGLEPGEQVVTEGAYVVLLASRGEQAIGHGHAH